MTVTIDQMIACAVREIGFRKRVYPRWVSQNKLTQKAADTELERMTAILELLRNVETGNDPIFPGVDIDAVYNR